LLLLLYHKPHFPMNLYKFFATKMLISPAIVLVFFSCTITDTGEDPFMEFSNFAIGGNRIEFNAARITITGPVNISGPSSHVWAQLELSTDNNFSQPYIPNSTMMTIGIRSVYTGKIIPDFPLQSGDYIVYPKTETINPAIIRSIDGKNFTSGPFIGINYFQDELVFRTVHEALEGKISIQFDLTKNRVRITHDWVTKEGEKVTGTNNLPLNLSSFNP